MLRIQWTSTYGIEQCEKTRYWSQLSMLFSVIEDCNSRYYERVRESSTMDATNFIYKVFNDDEIKWTNFIQDYPLAVKLGALNNVRQHCAKLEKVHSLLYCNFKILFNLSELIANICRKVDLSWKQASTINSNIHWINYNEIIIYNALVLCSRYLVSITLFRHRFCFIIEVVFAEREWLITYCFKKYILLDRWVDWTPPRLFRGAATAYILIHVLVS